MVEYIIYWYVIGAIMASLFRVAQSMTRFDGLYNRDIVSFIIDATVWPVTLLVTAATLRGK